MSEWLYRHKVISAIAALWAMGVVTWVVVRVFWDVSLINASVVAALSAVLGIPATAFGLWRWRNSGRDS